MNPLISVIIPVYNGAAFVRAALNSVLRSSYTRLQVICVDDGSTDNSLSICRSFALQDTRVEVYSQENKGDAGARNTALRYAKGDWLSFVDADDWISPDMYSNILEELTKFPAKDIDMVRLNSLPISDRHSFPVAAPKIKGASQLYTRDELVAKDLQGGYIHSLFVRASLVKQHSIDFDESVPIVSDKVFTFHCLLYSNFVLYHPNPLYYYFIHSKGISYFSSKNAKTFFTAFKQANLALEKVDDDLIAPSMLRLKRIYLVSHSLECLKLSIKQFRFDYLIASIYQLFRYRIKPNEIFTLSIC